MQVLEVDVRHLSAGAPAKLNEVEDARVLFREYGLSLKATQSCGYFNYERFEEEIAELPVPYTSRNGGLLVAYDQGKAVACIAYRVSPTEGDAMCEIKRCEIKRLYVSPRQRGQGLARKLVERVLEIVKAAGYSHVTLDTDVATMPGAQELYLSLGFAEYKAREGTIAFLDRSLA